MALALGAPEDSALVITLISLGSLTAILLPGAIIYGILRHRLFDLDLVVRKSVAYGAASLLIAAAYAVIAAAPGMMLGNRVPVTLAVVVTIAAALAFQPLRRRLESAVSRRLFGDRVRAVPATQEPRHDDGADGRARRTAASTRARDPRRNRRELGAGPAA